MSTCAGRLQISLLTLSKFKRINQLLFPLKSSEKFFLSRFSTLSGVFISNFEHAIAPPQQSTRKLVNKSGYSHLMTSLPKYGTMRMLKNCFLLDQFRSSRPEVFCEKGVFRNFAKFTGKHLCQSLFFKAYNFIKKETLAQVFFCEFCRISKNTFFYRTLPVAASVSRNIVS